MKKCLRGLNSIIFQMICKKNKVHKIDYDNTSKIYLDYIQIS